MTVVHMRAVLSKLQWPISSMTERLQPILMLNLRHEEMAMDMSMSAMSAMASSMSSMSMDMKSMASSAMASGMEMSGMAMSGMSMSGMSMPTSTAVSAAAATATSAASGMGGHSMGGMSMGGSCKISMLWNWYTIDACFISKSWHVTTRGKFAGTCIGVFVWVVALLLLQRAHREFDRYIYRQWLISNSSVSRVDSPIAESDACPSKRGFMAGAMSFGTSTKFRPNLWQQLVRAIMYTVEFGAGYLLMLMAMYYNGYILITMWLGALIGYFFIAGDTCGGDGHDETKKAPCC